MRLSLAVVMVCLAAACSDAEPLEIVSDGVGHATVVVAANDKDATTPAREIQTFVEKHDPCDSGERAYEILEPESWVGSPLPVMERIDIRDQLTRGNWLLLLYHHDCPDCIQAMRALCQQCRLASNPMHYERK